MPVQLGVEQEWVVTQRDEKFNRHKPSEKDDDPLNPWHKVTYDTESFAGSITLSQATPNGPSYFDTIDFDTSNRDEYDEFELGRVVLATFKFKDQTS